MKRNIILILLVISVILNGWFLYQSNGMKQQVNKASTQIAHGEMVRYLNIIGSINVKENGLKIDQSDFPKLFHQFVTGARNGFSVVGGMVHEMPTVLPSNLKEPLHTMFFLFEEKYVPLANRLLESDEISEDDIEQILDLAKRLNDSGFPSSEEWNWDMLEERLNNFLETEPELPQY
ncbi:hypothetical protein ACJ2A9_23100 [Anaerobacillus sp. MEB173]|uniref:hypothetical protein n=1 Tax=Anaerobacillus sp. MEB173 TaxID=3383345 RepID=UPI003F92E139